MAVQVYSYYETSGLWRAKGLPNISESADFVKPTVANTGPRITPTGSTLNSAQAIAAAEANGGVLQGAIMANMNFANASDGNLTFIDCIVTSGAFFCVEAWWGFGTPPADNVMVTFQNCEFYDAEAACVVGQNVELIDCNMHHAGDIVKPTGNFRAVGNIMHQLLAPNDEAHGDTVQIQSGSNILFQGNTLIGLNAADSPFNPGGLGSGTLQTGAANGNVSCQFLDNWVDGAVYTLRGAYPWWPAPFTAEMIFRRNKQGRNYGSGPRDSMGSDGGRINCDYDSSNVWEDTGLPVIGG